MQDSYPNASTSQAPVNEGLLATQFAPLVKRAAAHLRSQVGSGLDLEDVEQAGMMGLIQAIRRYGEIDDEFEAFAFVRIRGAMLDEIRSMDMRSRQSREETHRLASLRTKLYKQLYREPTDTELAKASGLPLEKVRDLIVSMQADTIGQLEDWMLNATSGGRNSLEEKREILSRALGRMNERQRLIISLYYYYGMNMQEIALTLDLTAPRVCQLHKECIAFLTKLLKD